MKRLTIAAAALGLCVGCVNPYAAHNGPAVPMESRFEYNEFENAMKKGACKVTGQAFLKTRGGDVKFGAGCTVELLPLNAYMRERVNRGLIGGENLEAIMPIISTAFTRRTTADGNGNFEFSDLPDGEWVALCSIYWEVPGPYRTSPTGGKAFGTAKVKGGESARIIVTR